MYVECARLIKQNNFQLWGFCAAIDGLSDDEAERERANYKINIEMTRTNIVQAPKINERLSYARG